MIEEVSISQLKENPGNPRTISEEKMEKLKRSIREFPEMLKLRPIVINKDKIVLGGNMRLKALKELGHKKAFIVNAESISSEQEREFIIKDNIGFGAWDWDMLANTWDEGKLEEWGLDLDYFKEDGLGEGFELEDGEREPFQQMTFSLADEQAEQIQAAISEVKGSEGFKYMETYGNENGNGNALYYIVSEWARQRK